MKISMNLNLHISRKRPHFNLFVYAKIIECLRYKCADIVLKLFLLFKISLWNKCMITYIYILMHIS
jgi:hypothetical protein